MRRIAAEVDGVIEILDSSMVGKHIVFLDMVKAEDHSSCVIGAAVGLAELLAVAMAYVQPPRVGQRIVVRLGLACT